MTRENGIVESSKVVILSKADADYDLEKEDFEITTPIIGAGELGSQISTVTLRKGDEEVEVEVKDIEDAVRKYAGQETLDVIRKNADEKRKSNIQKAFDALERGYNAISRKLDMAKDDAAQRDYENSIQGKVERMAQERVRKSARNENPMLSTAEAMAQIWVEKPELYEQFLKERANRIMFEAVQQREAKHDG